MSTEMPHNKNKYVSIILEADSIEKRKLLCEYFASVSPEGPIKKSWEEYELIVDKHIAEISENEKKLIVIAKPSHD